MFRESHAGEQGRENGDDQTRRDPHLPALTIAQRGGYFKRGPPGSTEVFEEWHRGLIMP